MIRIQTEDFSVQEEITRLTRGNDRVGGVVSFVGTVRDYSGDEAVTAMILEHYPGMTESELEKIEAAARSRFPIEEILVVHRVGRLSVSDNIVLVIATSRHRAAAFDACRYVIDHLKVLATFWKKEITSGGERWVSSCPGCEAAASQWEELRKVEHTHGKAPSHPAPPPHHHAIQQARWAGLTVGILTLSDTRTLASDGSGDTLEGLVRAEGGEVVVREVLPDVQERIQEVLIRWADERKLAVILTTGGTGPGPRDVTPEATRAVSAKELPGFSELIRAEGLKKVRSAILTRGICAFRGTTLIINFPGSRKGAAESFTAVADVIPHALRMALGGGH